MFVLLLFALSDCYSVSDVQGQVTISELFPDDDVSFGQGYNTLTLNTSEGIAVEGKQSLAVHGNAGHGNAGHGNAGHGNAGHGNGGNAGNSKASFTRLHYSISLYTSRAEYYEGVTGHGKGVSLAETAVGKNRSLARFIQVCCYAGFIVASVLCYKCAMFTVSGSNCIITGLPGLSWCPTLR